MLVKNYKGVAKTKNGLLYCDKLDNEFIQKVEENKEDIDYIKVAENILTIYTDKTMTEEYCTYIYIDEYDIYESNQMNKFHEVIRIVSIERKEFFDLIDMKMVMFDKIFYISIYCDLIDKDKNNRNVKMRVSLINDCPFTFWSFPNSLEELFQYFPCCELNKKVVKYIMGVSLGKHLNKVYREIEL